MAEPTFGLLAEFDTPERLVEAARNIRRDGYRSVDAFTPFPIEGLARILHIRETRVHRAGLLGGLGGAAVALGVQLYTNYAFQLDIGGRPLYALSAFAVVTFELSVLGAALSAALTMLYLCGLPRLHHPVFEAERFHLATKDRFFLCVHADDEKFDTGRTSQRLDELGALSIERVLP